MKQKIQKSMMLILLVTLFPFYVIMTVILYNQNLGILEKEVQQEAVYLSSGVDVAGEEYLKKLEPMIKADEDTRLTFISQSGDVLYDSDSSKKLENHKSRAEVKQANKNSIIDFVVSLGAPETTAPETTEEVTEAPTDTADITDTGTNVTDTESPATDDESSNKDTDDTEDAVYADNKN